MIVFPDITTQKKNSYKKAVNGFIQNSVTVPLKQDIEAECEPLVKEGETVREGQLIAQTLTEDGFDAIYSPIPGTVTEIGHCTCPDGKKENAVFIRLSGSFSYLGKKLHERDISKLTQKEILTETEKDGLINTFVTNEPVLLFKDMKRAMKEVEPVLVVRLFDDDPSRISDALITQLYFRYVQEGAKLCSEAIGASCIIYLTDADFPKPIGLTFEDPTTFVYCNSKKYPSGSINSIIKAVKKSSKVKPFTNISRNSLFTDSSTMFDLYRTLSVDMPLIDKYVHVNGDCLPASGLIKVAIGSSFRNLAEMCGGLVKKPGAIIVNGLVNGLSSGTLDAPVTKYVKSVSFVPSSSMRTQISTECIHCGSCRRVCPMSLSPDMIYKSIYNEIYSKNLYTESTKLCDNCGLCNSVCPSRLPLCQTIYQHAEKEDSNEKQ